MYSVYTYAITEHYEQRKCTYAVQCSGYTVGVSALFSYSIGIPMLFSYRVGVPTQEADNFELVLRCNFILTQHVT